MSTHTFQKSDPVQIVQKEKMITNKFEKSDSVLPVKIVYTHNITVILSSH